jgi:hypothetical protein
VGPDPARRRSNRDKDPGWIGSAGVATKYAKYKKPGLRNSAPWAFHGVIPLRRIERSTSRRSSRSNLGADGSDWGGFVGDSGTGQ